MAKFNLTNKAVEDLTKIWEYTFDKWSEKQADKYYYMLLENCQIIANNPNLEKNYERIKKDIFGYKVNRHIIFYRKFDNNPIEITRILHGKIDLKNRINE